MSRTIAASRSIIDWRKKVAWTRPVPMTMAPIISRLMIANRPGGLVSLGNVNMA